MSHTPGPWDRNIRPARKYPIIFSGRNTHVAQIIARPDDAEIEANCNLIAAAPDLLDALQTALEWLEAAQADEPDDWQNEPLNEAVDSAREAIAKATGETK